MSTITIRPFLAAKLLTFAALTLGGCHWTGIRGNGHLVTENRPVDQFTSIEAEGAFDISIDPVVSLWDVAALVPIVDAAGARWSTLDGRHDVDGGSFLCTNGLLHDTVVKALA